MNWLFLDKNNSDQYIQMLARGCGVEPTDMTQWQYEQNSEPLVLRGIMKHKIIKRCWQDGRWFWYMDSGYMGNRISTNNPGGWKHWHRVVPNDLQHGTVLPRSSDRFERLRIRIQPRQYGRDILLVAPDHKPCAFYGIDRETWLTQTQEQIRQHTDHPVIIRERSVDRRSRKQNDLAAPKNVHAVVTFNSVAATEAVLAGVPAFVLAPSNAAVPVANTDLSLIDKPWFAEPEQVHAWACHLAYGQFHIHELQDGTAARILTQTKEMLDV